MAPQYSQHKTTEASAEDRALVEGLAGYLKETTIYPDANIRVQAKLVALLATAVHLRGSRERVGVLLKTDGFHVDQSVIPPDTPMLDWLRGRLNGTALAGIELDDDVTPEAFHAFAEHLRDIYPRRHQLTTFEEMWPDSYEGLKLVPRHFEGRLGTHSHHGAPADDDDNLIDTASAQDRAVAELLESSDEILEQVHRIEDKLRLSGMQECQDRMLSLLGHIVHALPADALEDASEAVGYVEGVLGSFESAMDEADESDVRTGDLRLQALMHQLTHSFFGSLLNSEQGKAVQRKQAEAESLPDEPPRLRAEDEKILADLPRFLAEVEQMPRADNVHLLTTELEIPAELTGILLHQLVSLDDEAPIERTTARLEEHLPELDREELEVLTFYLRACLYADKREAVRLQRVFDLLQRSGNLHLFRETGALTHEVARFHFPRHFRLYVESLDPTREDEVDSIAHLCAELGPRRLYEAADELTDEESGVLCKGLIDRLFAQPHKSLIPLVHLALERGRASHKEPSLQLLKDLKLEAKEALPLWIFDAETSLPVDYLSAICKAEVTGHYPRELSNRAGRMIRHFIQSGSWADPESVSRRCYAISRLASFPSVETKTFLNELVKGTGFLGLTKAPRQIRQAAQAAMLSMP